jgi:dolichyl-diphosphooligosaccharide---protein glycosyltransferase subunit DAD1/OST2
MADTILGNLLSEYKSKTSQRIKLIDAYLFYVLLTGLVQAVYVALIGTFPFNSFLSGFLSSIGSFILAGTCLSV